jgi:hypothetical protein
VWEDSTGKILGFVAAGLSFAEVTRISGECFYLTGLQVGYIAVDRSSQDTDVKLRQLLHLLLLQAQNLGVDLVFMQNNLMPESGTSILKDLLFEDSQMDLKYHLFNCHHETLSPWNIGITFL